MERLSFIKYAALAASGSMVGLSPFGRMTALAQAADYKALLCIFLSGGNDSNNMVVPTDAANYSLYQLGRGALSIPHGQLLALKNLNFGLHPSMPEMQSAFNSSGLALVANVGSLVQPMTMAQYKDGTVPVPQSLWSHSDQASIWQAATAGSGVSIGWGGSIADLMNTRYGSRQLPMDISTAGLSIFTAGVTTSPFVSPGVGSKIWCAEANLCDARLSAAQQMLQLDSGATLVQADSQRTSKMYSYLDVFTNAVGQAPKLQTQFPQTALGEQLQQITQVIQSRSILGANRQIFFAQLNGFDLHSAQLSTHASLLSQLSGAMGAFRQAMQEIGTDSEVTTFTMSEFSRPLVGNVAQGSDHAWGSHHMVMGGAVKGGSLFGTFPNLTVGGPDDVMKIGRWLPSTSVTQYGASLASWFGVAQADMSTIFPLLPNFPGATLKFI